MIWMLTVLILLISGEFLKTVESSCTLNDNQYEEGQKWHPNLIPFGSRCVECTCKLGEVKCIQTVKCPPVECVNPKTDPRMCCPVCEDFANIPPTVDIDSSKNGGNGGKECVYEGKKYLHGDIFPSNSTGIVPTSKKQCVNCACTNGQVFCHLKTCDIPKGCKMIIKDAKDCCPKCADAPEDYSQTIMDKFDCEANGQIHRNNTKWNPTFADRVMPCITCKCLNGLVHCEKEECPKLTCKRKRRPKKGQCCETCKRGKRKRGKKKSKDQSKCKSKSNSKKGKRKSRKGRKRRRNKINRGGPCLKQNQIDTISVNSSLPNLFSQTNATQHCLFQYLCLPKKTKYLVYRNFINNSHAYFAFDDLNSPTIEVWRWNVNSTSDSKGGFDIISGFQELQYPAEWFRQQITDDRLNMIFGAARKKKLSTFKRRLKRTYQRCEADISKGKKKHCTNKILMQEILCADFEDIDRKCSKKKSRS